jgi:hypothetical protein
MDGLIERTDILNLLFDEVSNRHLLLLSMCCRRLRDAVDAAHNRLGRGLFIGNFARDAVEVREYADNLVLRIDCSLERASGLAHKLMLSLTGLPGEILAMGLQVHGIHMDAEFLHTLPFMRFRTWQVDFTDLHNTIHPLYGRHSLRLINVDAVCPKMVVMYIENIELGIKSRCRRSLLALRQQHMCMACNVRAYAYTCVLASNPRLRRVCKRCACELLVSTRILYREWKIGTGHRDLQLIEGKYRGSAGAYAGMWISKEDVAAFFGVASWSAFVAGTAQRLRARHGAITMH